MTYPCHAKAVGHTPYGLAFVTAILCAAIIYAQWKRRKI